MCCSQVYLQHTAQSAVSDDAMLLNINAELDKLLSIADRYSTAAQDFPPLADNHFCPGFLPVCIFALSTLL